MKDTFDLKNFLIENKLTESSRGDDMRVHFGNGLNELERNDEMVGRYDREWLPAGELESDGDTDFVSPDELMGEAEFDDAANRQLRDYGDEETVDQPEQDSGTFDPVGSAFASTTEQPEDFSGYDEKSIRRSYQSLKNQKVSDDKAMKILARSYDIPEKTLRSMFRDVFLNARQKDVQTTEPRDRVGMTLSKKKNAAELAAEKDIAASGDYNDTDLDRDDTVRKPTEDDFDPEEEDIPVDPNSPDYREVFIPANFDFDMTEQGLQKYLNGFKQPEKATTFLQRAINTTQKAAAEKGSGNLYLYLGTDGYYHPLTSQLSPGDEFRFRRGSTEYTAKVKKFMATIDCSSAQAPGRGGRALTKAQTVDTSTSNVEEPNDDNPVDLTPKELYATAHSPWWRSLSMKEKIQDPAWKYSDEYRASKDDDDEPVDDEFAKKFTDADEEEPINWNNPEDRDWAIKWATRK